MYIHIYIAYSYETILSYICVCNLPIRSDRYLYTHAYLNRMNFRRKTEKLRKQAKKLKSKIAESVRKKNIPQLFINIPLLY